MSAVTKISSAARNLIYRLPLLKQAREMHWTLHHNSKTLDRISADVRRLADKTDTQVALTEKLHNVMVDQYLDAHLHNNPRYSEPGRLARHERQVFSQGGEDGIIAEIFSRIGTSNRFFIEFGVGNGLENNTTALLVKEWSGLWIEANDEWARDIERDFHALLSTKQLRLRHAFVTAENIESLFEAAGVPKEFDLLCVDIDGNDFWVWQAIDVYKPRVVVIEYNAIFGSETRWAMRYDPEAVWNGTSHQGASLKSLEGLAEQKGYHLVGCSFSGVNAFFVRRDLVGNAFCHPFTAENHYEPARYHLLRTSGHPRGFGNFARP